MGTATPDIPVRGFRRSYPHYQKGARSAVSMSISQAIQMVNYQLGLGLSQSVHSIHPRNGSYMTMIMSTLAKQLASRIVIAIVPLPIPHQSYRGAVYETCHTLSRMFYSQRSQSTIRIAIPPSNLPPSHSPLYLPPTITAI